MGGVWKLQDFGHRSRSSSLRKIGDDQFSPGLFDLHSFDTDLLPELKPLNQAAAASRGENNNLTKSMSLDKERLNSNNNVAKIKVVVCWLCLFTQIKIFSCSCSDWLREFVILQVRKRPLNKKEIAKKEEDIITIESNSNSNSLTVHETKLKVISACWLNVSFHWHCCGICMYNVNPRMSSCIESLLFFFVVVLNGRV